MRNAYIVCYDISDPKRWRKVHKLMLGVGDPVQWSVFRCDLSRTEKIILMEKLVPVMNQSEDRLMLVDLGPAGEDHTGDDRVECWGRPLAELPKRGAVIV